MIYSQRYSELLKSIFTIWMIFLAYKLGDCKYSKLLYTFTIWMIFFDYKLSDCKYSTYLLIRLRTVTFDYESNYRLH